MTRAEREQLITRYLDGGMSQSEEHDFFIQVALDSELRSELKAHRLIEDSAHDYLSRERTRHTALRSRTMAMLGSYPAAPQAPAAASWMSRAAGAFRSALGHQMTWLALGVAALGIVGGSLLLGPDGEMAKPAETSRPIAPVNSEGVKQRTPIASPSVAPSSSVLPDRPATAIERDQAKPSEQPASESSARLGQSKDRPAAATARKPAAKPFPAKNPNPAATLPHERKRNPDDSINIGVDVIIDPVKR